MEVIKCSNPECDGTLIASKENPFLQSQKCHFPSSFPVFLCSKCHRVHTITDHKPVPIGKGLDDRGNLEIETFFLNGKLVDIEVANP
ncbi:MAG: hypothetical protein ABIG60_00095 [Patescibacteria group bacterium]